MDFRLTESVQQPDKQNEIKPALCLRTGACVHTEDSTTSSRCPSLVGSSDSYFLLNAISVYCCCWERPLLLGQPIHLSTNTTSLQLSSDTTTSAAPPVRQTAHLRHAYLGFLFRVCLRGKNASILDTKTAQVVFEDTQTAQIVFEDTQTAQVVFKTQHKMQRKARNILKGPQPPRLWYTHTAAVW